MNKEIEELLNNLKYASECDDFIIEIRKDRAKLLLSYIEQLEKKAELGEHYKHLYSEVKKQKDDVVEYIKESIKHPMYAENIIADCDGGRVENLDKLLRMLGEID